MAYNTEHRRPQRVKWLNEYQGTLESVSSSLYVYLLSLSWKQCADIPNLIPCFSLSSTGDAIDNFLTPKTAKGASGEECSKKHAGGFLKKLLGCKFVLKGETVYTEYYCDVLRCLRKNIWREQS